MKNNSSRILMILSILILLMISADLTSPLIDTTDFKFEIGSRYGDRKKNTVPSFSEGGCILAQVKPWPWSSTSTSGIPASELALIINGSDQTGYYARSDGKLTSVVPLWVSYAVPATKVSNNVTWTVSIVNFSRSGTAKGNISVEYPPTLLPCEFKALVSKTKGNIDLSWRYIGKAFNGFFIIERSTNNRDWNQVVSACSKASPTVSSATKPIDYGCTDTNLTSGSTYYYRACTLAYTTKIPSVLNCTKAKYITPALNVNVP